MAIDTQQQIKRGFLWFGSATALSQVVDLISTLVLLHFMSREEMGLAGLSWSIAVIVEAFNGLGVGSALVQAPELSRDQEDSLFWFAIGVGLLMCGILAAFSPVIAWFYSHPVLIGMVCVSGIKLVFVSTALIPIQLLNRHLKFKEISALESLSTLLAGLTKIVLAALGAGAWSLVIANTMRGFYQMMAAFWISGWRPRLHAKLSEIRWHISFGWRAASSGVLFQAYRNADALVVGRELGMEILGLYRTASETAMAALEAVLQVIRRVAYPVFARVAGTEELPKTFLNMTTYLICLNGPIALFLCFGAADLLEVITDPKWGAAAPIAQILCFGGLLRGLARLFSELYVASGHPWLALIDSFLSMLVLFGVFISAAKLLPQYGALSVAVAWLVAYPLIIAILLQLARRAAGVSTLAYLKNAVRPLCCMVLTSVAIFEVQQLIHLPYAWMRLVLLAVTLVVMSLVTLRLICGMNPKSLIPKAPPKKPVEQKDPA